MASKQPKQYLQVAGVTLLEHSLRALLACEQLNSVVVVLHADDTVAAGLSVFQHPSVQTVVGAAQRSGSVMAGLLALESCADLEDWVLVHDAARPCLQARDIDRLIAAVTATGIGGILAAPIVDTVKQASADGHVVQTLNRDALWGAQTPQMFRLGELLGALRQAEAAGRVVTDEASAMEMAGFPVQLVAGTRRNIKVTVADDLLLATWYLEQQQRSTGE